MTKADLIAALAALPDDAEVMVDLADHDLPEGLAEVTTVDTFKLRPDHPDSKPFAVLSMDYAEPVRLDRAA